MRKSKGHIHLMTTPMGDYQCNCSIIFSEKTKSAIIIDPGNDHHSLMNIINKLQIKPKLLLHTHAHFDHIGRSSEIKSLTGAELLLHREDMFLYERLPEQGKFFGQNVGTPLPIDRYIQDEDEFKIDDPELNMFIKSIHTPGHTPGSCCFYSEFFDTPTLFSGDTLFMQSIGRTDLPGGDSRKIIRSIKDRLLTLADETEVTPGHGPDTRIFEEKKFNPFLC